MARRLGPESAVCERNENLSGGGCQGQNPSCIKQHSDCYNVGGCSYSVAYNVISGSESANKNGEKVERTVATMKSL
jgi:hypothetical protein